MDRNAATAALSAAVCAVALRKESVDRNVLSTSVFVVFSMVALRKESVDRNVIVALSSAVLTKSLSARRAWIEILSARRFCSP